MIRQVPFEPSHLMMMKKRWFYEGDTGVDDYIIGITKQHGTYCWSLVVDDDPIAVVGATFVWSGVMTLWSVTTDRVMEKPLSFAKVMKKLVESYAKMLGVHRMQFEIRTDWENSKRWAEFLGFHVEAVMKQFGQKRQDFYLCARLF